MIRILTLFSIALLCGPAFAVTVAVMPTGDVDIDVPLQAATEGRAEVQTLSAEVVRTKLDDAGSAGFICVGYSDDCLGKIGLLLDAEWILVPHEEAGTLRLGLFDLAAGLELFQVTADLRTAEAPQVVIDRALGRLLNPQAAGSVEVQTEAESQVTLDGGEAKLGPVAVFEAVAPGEHVVKVDAGEGRVAELSVTVKGDSRMTVNIRPPEKVAPSSQSNLVLVGATITGVAAAVGVAGLVVAAHGAISQLALDVPLYDVPIVREVSRLSVIPAVLVAASTLVPIIAGGTIATVGLLVE